MVPDDISSDGRPPESELYDRLRHNKPVSLPRDGEMVPSRLLEVRETSITAPLALHVTPSHSQQSMLSRQGTVTPSSCDSSARNWSSELFSCLLHEVAGEAMERSNTRGRTKKAMASLEHGVLWMFFLMKNLCFDLSSKGIWK